ncbi:MAG TPA: glutathione transferase GstA [Rhodanobacteraceae bacterium]|nr:glutathione transferase GstA [Rhodanobacteraceae bacterium]
MKLYYSPGACSLSPRIVALEAGLDLAYEKVDGKAKRTESGKDFWQINPKGYVPALQLDDGAVLTEGPAIVQYLADLRPASALAPANGSLARYRLQEALGYINSELHKSYSPLFNPATPEATREERKEYLRRRYALIEATLTRHPYLLGDDFTVADAYLFTVTRWAQFVDLDLTAFPHLQAFQQLVAARPAVARALEAEGLLKKAA